MKLTAMVALSLLILGLTGMVWLRQRQKDQAAQEQAAALQFQVQSLEVELAQRPSPVPPRSDDTAPPLRASLPTAPVAVAPVNPKAAPNPPMMNDPETRALMRKQQDQALARMADKLVNKDFARDWNLSVDQTAQARKLVQEKVRAGKDLLDAMLFDGLDDDALALRGRDTRQRIEQANEALRGVLGSDGFDALVEREHAQEDAGRLKHMQEEFANSEEPLTKPQADALLAAMAAERQAFSFRVDYEDASKIDPDHIRDHFSEANLEKYHEDMAQLNARIVERASLFLSPAQIQQLKIAQENQLEQARLTVKMTTELFNKRRPN